MGEAEVQAGRDEGKENKIIRVLAVAYPQEKEEELMVTFSTMGLNATPILITPDIPDDILGTTVRIALGIAARRDD